MDKFIKIILTGDLSLLVISGNPDVNEAWEKIYSEYCSITNDNSSTHLLQLSKEISYLTNRLEHINQIASWLNNQRSEELISILQKELGFRFTYEDLTADIQRTLTLAKSEIVRLQKRQSELEQLQNVKGSEQTEQGFIETFQVLSKFQGYQLRAKDITVSEYCAAIKDFNAHQKVAQNGR